jgi:hypothetical protein
MLQVAVTLFKQSNKLEAKRLWSEARRLRSICFRMVAEADNLERDLRGGSMVLPIRSTIRYGTPLNSLLVVTSQPIPPAYLAVGWRDIATVINTQLLSGAVFDCKGMSTSSSSPKGQRHRQECVRRRGPSRVRNCRPRGRRFRSYRTDYRSHQIAEDSSALFHR